MSLRAVPVIPPFIIPSLMMAEGRACPVLDTGLRVKQRSDVTIPVTGLVHHSGTYNVSF